MIVVKYAGNKAGDTKLVLKDKRFKKAYDFSTGSCECTNADAKVIVTENPLAFSVDNVSALGLDTETFNDKVPADKVPADKVPVDKVSADKAPAK